MHKFGQEGDYIVGFKILALSDSEIANIEAAKKSNILDSVKSQIQSITLTDMYNLVKDPSALDTIKGLQKFYPAATLSNLSNLMSSKSLNSLIGSCCKSLGAAARAITSAQVAPTQELSLALKEGDFFRLVVNEYIGFTLPMYEFTFLLHNKAYLKYLNSTSQIELTWGKSTADAITMKATIYNVKQGIHGDDLIITLSGYLLTNNYLTTERHVGIDGTSYDVFKQLAPQYGFKFNSNITQTNDKMIWKADNVLPREFLTKVWQHSFVSQQSQMLTAIDCQGRLNFKDISELRKVADKKKIQIMDRMTFKKNPFYANFGSMRKQRYIYNVKTNTMSLLNLNDTTGAVVSSKTDGKLQGNRIGKFSVLSPDMHENWYVAELLNQAKLCGSLAQIAPVLVTNNWKAYELLDIITANSVVTSECGQYIVVGKLYGIYNKQINVYLQLARDTYSPITGSLNVT